MIISGMGNLVFKPRAGLLLWNGYREEESSIISLDLNPNATLLHSLVD